MPTLTLLRKRDSKEKEIRIAFSQKKAIWENMRLQTAFAEKKLENYKNWCEENKVEPLLDFNLYK